MSESDEFKIESAKPQVPQIPDEPIAIDITKLPVANSLEDTQLVSILPQDKTPRPLNWNIPGNEPPLKPATPIVEFMDTKGKIRRPETDETIAGTNQNSNTESDPAPELSPVAEFALKRLPSELTQSQKFIESVNELPDDAYRAVFDAICGNEDTTKDLGLENKKHAFVFNEHDKHDVLGNPQREYYDPHKALMVDGNKLVGRTDKLKLPTGTSADWIRGHIAGKEKGKTPISPYLVISATAGLYSDAKMTIKEKAETIANNAWNAGFKVDEVQLEIIMQRGWKVISMDELENEKREIAKHEEFKRDFTRGRI